MSSSVTAPVTTAIPPTISSRPPPESSPNTLVLREPFNIDGFRLAWPADQFRNKGPTALDEAVVRREAPASETPQFGFITSRRFTGFPVMSRFFASAGTSRGEQRVDATAGQSPVCCLRT